MWMPSVLSRSIPPGPFGQVFPFQPQGNGSSISPLLELIPPRGGTVEGDRGRTGGGGGAEEVPGWKQGTSA